jgi:hypothetical protein
MRFVIDKQIKTLADGPDGVRARLHRVTVQRRERSQISKFETAAREHSFEAGFVDGFDVCVAGFDEAVFDVFE